jgi:hypothetical protein
MTRRLVGDGAHDHDGEEDTPTGIARMAARWNIDVAKWTLGIVGLIFIAVVGGSGRIILLQIQQSDNIGAIRASQAALATAIEDIRKTLQQHSEKLSATDNQLLVLASLPTRVEKQDERLAEHTRAIVAANEAFYRILSDIADLKARVAANEMEHASFNRGFGMLLDGKRLEGPPSPEGGREAKGREVRR